MSGKNRGVNVNMNSWKLKYTNFWFSILGTGEIKGHQTAVENTETNSLILSVLIVVLILYSSS